MQDDESASGQYLSPKCVIARRPQADVAIRTPAVSLRGAKRRGNLLASTDGRFQIDDTSQRLPRPLRGLAMTSSSMVPAPNRVIARRRSRRGNPYPSRVIARSEATWQSPGINGREISDRRYFPEIATAPAGPRNDIIVDGICP